jgi:hypothetical protein
MAEEYMLAKGCIKDGAPDGVLKVKGCILLTHEEIKTLLQSMITDSVVFDEKYQSLADRVAPLYVKLRGFIDE